ncbi:MAG: tetraacyldisaccharide 4'-kinase [Candidatus Helarchaeota archaeon]|nr:tetraacyldisaccharide 4'-kinase [Candidatus Helarchaeota archaeon]
MKVTIRFELLGTNYLNTIIERREGCIPVFWHGEMMIPMMYHTDKGFYVLVSRHRDGEIIARILKGLGYNLIRGSSTKGGKKVFLEMVSLLRVNNVVAVTPDGPRGPYRKFKIGAVSLAQKSGCPIIPIFICAKNRKVLKSWDKFIIVKPFSKCVISYGEPIYIEENLEKDDLEKFSKELENKILLKNKEIEKHFTKEKLNKIRNKEIYFNRFISIIFLPFSYIYRFIILIREYLYKKNIFKTHSLSKFVVSIGNLTLGGTGKTPMTIWLADFIRKRGIKTAILSRGFKGKGRKAKIIYDGINIIGNVKDSGDEPMLMTRKLKNVPIIVGRKKYKSGILAEKNFKSDVFILDDGFQHIALKRDLNILLLNGDKPFGNGKIFPAGSLREPISNINRADIIVMTKTGDLSEEMIDEVRKYTQAQIFLMMYNVLCLRTLDGNEVILPDELSCLKSTVFSGIADHQYFIKTVINSGVEVLDYIKFPDHHNYKKRDIKKIISSFTKSKADLIITTGKDAVKINDSLWKPFPFYYVDIGVEIYDSEKFEEMVMDKIKEKSFL